MLEVKRRASAADRRIPRGRGGAARACAGLSDDLELAQDERIENVAVGNANGWQVTPNRRGDRLFIKALQAGAPTNMTVITSSRLYAIELVGLDAPSPEMAYVVRYTYAEEKDADAVAVAEIAPNTR